MTPILNWIKAHLIIVIMCAIAVIVLPVVLYASSSWNASIANEIKKRVNEQDQRMTRVSSAQIVVKPLAPGARSVETSMALNARMLEEYQAVRQAIKADATALERWVVDVNRAGKETQLVPGLLPEPSRVQMNELPFRIHGAYIRSHEDLLRNSGAGMPLAPELVQEQLIEFERNFRRTQFNVGSEVTLTDTERTKLREAMTARRLAIYAQAAQEHSVFADIRVFNLDPWPDQKAPDKFRWYEWQHTYWLNSDIMAAIRRANTVDGERTPVFGDPSSVVKRIVNILPERLYPTSVTEESVRRATEQAPSGAPEGGFGGMEGGFGGMEGGMEGVSFSKMGAFETPSNERGSSSSGSAAAPSATSYADPNQPFPTDYSKSISGRSARTGLYDMRTVKVTLVVDSRRLQHLFDAFHTTNFMSVVGFRSMPVDVTAELAQGFYYGADPVILVELDIESLWLRDWTVDLMPPIVREHFGIQEKSPQG